MINRAHQHALKTAPSVAQARAEYDGACIDFAGDLADSVPGSRLIHFDIDDPASPWRYHAAVEIDGVIHDLWQEAPLPVETYLKLLSAVNVCYPCEEPDPE